MHLTRIWNGVVNKSGSLPFNYSFPLKMFFKRCFFKKKKPNLAEFCNHLKECGVNHLTMVNQKKIVENWGECYSSLSTSSHVGHRTKLCLMRRDVQYIFEMMRTRATLNFMSKIWLMQTSAVEMGFYIAIQKENQFIVRDTKRIFKHAIERNFSWSWKALTMTMRLGVWRCWL